MGIWPSIGSHTKHPTYGSRYDKPSRQEPLGGDFIPLRRDCGPGGGDYGDVQRPSAWGDVQWLYRHPALPPAAPGQGLHVGCEVSRSSRQL